MRFFLVEEAPLLLSNWSPLPNKKSFSLWSVVWFVSEEVEVAVAGEERFLEGACFCLSSLTCLVDSEDVDLVRFPRGNAISPFAAMMNRVIYQSILLLVLVVVVIVAVIVDSNYLNQILEWLTLADALRYHGHAAEENMAMARRGCCAAYYFISKNNLPPTKRSTSHTTTSRHRLMARVTPDRRQ